MGVGESEGKYTCETPWCDKIKLESWTLTRETAVRQHRVCKAPGKHAEGASQSEIVIKCAYSRKLTMQPPEPREMERHRQLWL